jgi:hypothetical protein
MGRPEGPNLATCPHFKVDYMELQAGAAIGNPDPDHFSIITITSGEIQDNKGTVYSSGDFLLLPRGLVTVDAVKITTLLQTTLPH